MHTEHHKLDNIKQNYQQDVKKKRNILNKFLFRYIRKNLFPIPTIRCPTISYWFYSIII